jgi:alkane 1-monooxygenase
MQRWMPHLLGLITPLATLFGVLMGGWWSATTIVLLLVVYPFLDVLLGDDDSAAPVNKGRMFDSIVHLHGVLVPVAVLVLLWQIHVTGLDQFTVLAAVSIGLSSGASGIVTAHELGHRRPRSFSWWLARLDLLCVMYLHYTTEHNHTHHKHWARDVDPTSSPVGRNLYVHVFRTVPLQAVGAWRARPVDTGRCFAIEGFLLVGMFLFNPAVLGGFLLQAGVAVFVLEYVNYLQHHGLHRGDDERGGAVHAWEGRSRWSRWTLLELPLHPSHHLKSSLPYYSLETHDDAPQLPFGFYMMFWLALIPPVFSRVMAASVARTSLDK